MAVKKTSDEARADAPIPNRPYDEPALRCATTQDGNLDDQDQRGRLAAVQVVGPFGEESTKVVTL